jgi:hypothetical protein
MGGKLANSNWKKIKRRLNSAWSWLLFFCLLIVIPALIYEAIDRDLRMDRFCSDFIASDAPASFFNSAASEFGSTGVLYSCSATESGLEANYSSTLNDSLNLCLMSPNACAALMVTHTISGKRAYHPTLHIQIIAGKVASCRQQSDVFPFEAWKREHPL